MEDRSRYGISLSNSEKHTGPDLVWDDTRAFLAVARGGTLSAAASELNLGIATLSRRIERLEKALSVPLFTRHQSGYQLTEEGADLVEKAEALEAAAAAFTSGIATTASIAGKVRLATAENLATGLILPALPDFCHMYPGVCIELLTDILAVNLHRRDADLALRMVKPDRGNVKIRRIGMLGFGLYCSPGYADKRQGHSNGPEYSHDPFIAWADTHSQLPAARRIEQFLRGREPALATTSLFTQVVAAQAGLGLAVLPHFIAVDANLVCVSRDVGVEQPIYLVIQADLAQSRRVRALADFLVDLVQRNRVRLLG